MHIFTNHAFIELTQKTIFCGKVGSRGREVLDCVYLISEGLDLKVDVAKDISIPFFQRGFGFFYFLGKAIGVPMNYLDQADLTMTKLERSRVHIDSKQKGLGVFRSSPMVQRKIEAWLEAIIGW